MNAIYCYAWVEDAPSAAVARRLVQHRNESAPVELRFVDGFPDIAGGYGDIKHKCGSFLKMANAGIHVFAITDLDAAPCASGLVLDWFSPAGLPLPEKLYFRVAVREIEAWLLADLDAFASYLGIPAANFSSVPESLPDPKQHLLNVIRQKSTKSIHREMLPRRNMRIGPAYNEVLTKFVQTKWSPARAAAHAPSLSRAIHALEKF
jgi:hypothetical protein